jgi:hypothetical protein
MTHEEALNLILSHACGGLTEEEMEKYDGFQEYTIELHCKRFVVKAKCLNPAIEPLDENDLPSQEPYRFEIRSVEPY